MRSRGAAAASRAEPEVEQALPPRPILKWAGGKSRLLPEILRLLPEHSDTYYEPFLGGAAVFFSLAHAGRFRRAVLSDRNRDLVDVYRAVKGNVASLIDLLRAFPHSRDEYYRVRELDPARLDLVERAARTIYLNRTGYNGLYRVNRDGKFNVPFGRYTNPNYCDAPRLHAAASALKSVKLEVADFESMAVQARAGDSIYFDPPYVPVSKTANFASYHHESFALADHERLAKMFGKLERRGVIAVLSNSCTPFTRQLFQDFDWRKVRVSRPINSRAGGRGRVDELLVVTRPSKGKGKPAR